MRFTYYGYSCFSVFAGGKTLLFDPCITPNEQANAIDVDAVGADYIFVSHGQNDHIMDAVRIAKRTGAMVLCNWELYYWFNKNGLTNIYPINPGGQFTFDFGVVKCLIAQYPGTLTGGSCGGVACRFAFNTPDGNFYYSGDTGLTLDMQLIPEWTRLDFAVLPIGDGIKMGLGAAIGAARTVGANKVVGIHCDSPGFRKKDQQNTIDMFAAAGMTLHIPKVGSVMVL